MNKAILIAAGLILATAPAFAQGHSRSDDRDRYSDRDDRGDRDRGSWRHHMDDDDDRGERRSRGARFMMRTGDSMIDVRCDPGESMRSCVDATMTLMDRVRSLPPATTNPGTGPASPPR